MANDIVINLLAFAGNVAQGSSQVNLLTDVAALGVKKAEIRREWIKDFTKELLEIRVAAREFGLELYYSIPAVLFKNGILDSGMLVQVLNEAKTLGATRIKLAVGEFNDKAENEIVLLRKILNEHNVLLTVEGDQSQINGRLVTILNFIENCHAKDVPAFVTFDVGNFIWVGEDPLYNAVKLAPYVRYIHLKGVKMTPQGPQVTDLENSDYNWQKTLALLPQNVPVGIEFPCGDDPKKYLIRAIEAVKAC